MFHDLSIRAKVWLVRLWFRTNFLLQCLSTNAPEYTKFPPDRSFSIRSSSSRRRIKVKVYEPNGFDKNKSYPVHLNFHGSGFMIDMFGTDADFCRMISKRTGAIVLDCDYAKAPEYPFPAAPDDVKDIIDYVVANAEGYFDTSRITIGGFSAGGTLALTAGVSQPKGTLKGIVAIYPCADLSLETAINVQPPVSEGNKSPIPPWFNYLVRDTYIPPGTDMADPRLSPIYTPAATLPEDVLMIVCQEDSLRHDAVGLAKRLQADGINVVLKDMQKVVHAWDKNAEDGTPGGAAKRDAYEAVVDMLGKVYGTK